MTSPAAAPLAELSLPVTGMTCASCVARIERFLARADGVEDAAVNLATERATVRFHPDRIDRSGIVAAIEAAGYDVAAPASTGESVTDEAERERRALLRDALLATGIGLAMMAISMWPGGLWSGSTSGCSPRPQWSSSCSGADS
jgi:Cu+-exporting ATPase